MISIARVKVLGFKRFKGTLEGKEIDSGKLFIEVNLNGQRNGKDSWASGVCTEEIRLPNGEFCKQLEHVPMPAQVELQLERVSNGKESRETVVSAQLVEQVPAVVPKVVKAA